MPLQQMLSPPCSDLEGKPSPCTTSGDRNIFNKMTSSCSSGQDACLKIHNIDDSSIADMATNSKCLDSEVTNATGCELESMQSEIVSSEVAENCKVPEKDTERATPQVAQIDTHAVSAQELEQDSGETSTVDCKWTTYRVQCSPVSEVDSIVSNPSETDTFVPSPSFELSPGQVEIIQNTSLLKIPDLLAAHTLKSQQLFTNDDTEHFLVNKTGRTYGRVHSGDTDSSEGLEEANNRLEQTLLQSSEDEHTNTTYLAVEQEIADGAFLSQQKKIFNDLDNLAPTVKQEKCLTDFDNDDDVIYVSDSESDEEDKAPKKCNKRKQSRKVKATKKARVKTEKKKKNETAKPKVPNKRKKNVRQQEIMSTRTLRLRDPNKNPTYAFDSSDDLDIPNDIDYHLQMNPGTSQTLPETDTSENIDMMMDTNCDSTIGQQELNAVSDVIRTAMSQTDMVSTMHSEPTLLAQTQVTDMHMKGNVSSTGIIVPTAMKPQMSHISNTLTSSPMTGLHIPGSSISQHQLGPNHVAGVPMHTSPMAQNQLQANQMAPPMPTSAMSHQISTSQMAPGQMAHNPMGQIHYAPDVSRCQQNIYINESIVVMCTNYN